MWKRKTIIFFCNYYSIRRDECTKFIFKHALHGIMIWLSRVKCINGLHVGYFLCFFVVCWFCTFIQIQPIRQNLSEISPDCQTIFIQIRPVVGLIRDKIVGKGYQQTTLAVREFSSEAKCHTPTSYLSLL